MKWEVKYKENVFDGIHIVCYPYIDHRAALQTLMIYGIKILFQKVMMNLFMTILEQN